jgi:CheY-like chemotaxis protein
MASILIVDDHPHFRKTIAELLAGEDFEITEAGTGEEAIEVLAGMVQANNVPDLCLIDALLPKMSGFNVADRLLEGDLDSAIIFMSGVFKSRDHQQENIQKYSARAYLVKPFDTDALLNYCYEATGRTRTVEAETGGEESTVATPLPTEGSLIDYPVLHLLWRAANERHTGILDVFGLDGRSRIFVYRGRATMAQCSSPKINVGVELIRSGALTAGMYQSAIELCADRGRGLHEVLKSEVWATETDIKEAYKATIPRVLGFCIASSGRFRWTQTDGFAKIIPSAPVSLQDAIKFAMRETSSIKDLEAHVMPRASLRLGPGENWGRIGAILEEACGSSSLSRAINGRATIAQLIAAARNDEDKLARLRQTFLLMSTSGVIASADVIKLATKEIPVVVPKATEQKKAVSSKPTAATDSAVRSDEDLANDAQLDFSEEEIAARKKIEEKYESVTGKNHWETLGVKPGADPAEIKRGYLNLARDYHIDKFAGLTIGSAEKVQFALFSQIQDAYSTLSDDTKRGEYEAKYGMEQEGKSTDIGAIFQAENDFSKGKLLTERGEYLAAFRLFENALKVNPANREWEAYKIYTQWFEHRNASEASAAMKAIDEIQEEFSNLFELSYFAGHIAMEAGQLKRALTFLRRCLKGAPNHTAAQRAMRIVVGKLESTDKKSGGLMGRFRKG